MTWSIHDIAKAKAEAAGAGDAGKTIMLELNRLNNHHCLWCSGWGHGARDCPTKVKLDQLRLGVREQAKVLDSVKKATRVKIPAVSVATCSLLTVKKKSMLKKRLRSQVDFEDAKTDIGSQ